MQKKLKSLLAKINEFKSSNAMFDENAVQGFLFKKLGFMMQPTPASGFAVFSEEIYEQPIEKLEEWQQKYRYYYYENFAKPYSKSAIFIMFNPSYTSPDKDDHTIRNCRFIANKEYSEMEIVNIFAERNPDIKSLTHENNELNKEFLKLFLEDRPNSDIILAWGYGKEEEFAKEIAEVKQLVDNNKKFYITVKDEIPRNNHPAPPAWYNYDGGFRANAVLKK